MQKLYLLSILLCILRITNESLLTSLVLPKTEISKIELKNLKNLYACYPEESEICGRAKEAKISNENHFDCYEEVKFLNIFYKINLKM